MGRGDQDGGFSFEFGPPTTATPQRCIIYHSGFDPRTDLHVSSDRAQRAQDSLCLNLKEAGAYMRSCQMLPRFLVHVPDHCGGKWVTASSPPSPPRPAMCHAGGVVIMISSVAPRRSFLGPISLLLPALALSAMR